MFVELAGTGGGCEERDARRWVTKAAGEDEGEEDDMMGLRCWDGEVVRVTWW